MERERGRGECGLDARFKRLDRSRVRSGDASSGSVPLVLVPACADVVGEDGVAPGVEPRGFRSVGCEFGVFLCDALVFLSLELFILSLALEPGLFLAPGLLLSLAPLLLLLGRLLRSLGGLLFRAQLLLALAGLGKRTVEVERSAGWGISFLKRHGRVGVSRRGPRMGRGVEGSG